MRRRGSCRCALIAAGAFVGLSLGEAASAQVEHRPRLEFVRSAQLGVRSIQAVMRIDAEGDGREELIVRSNSPKFVHFLQMYGWDPARNAYFGPRAVFVDSLTGGLPYDTDLLPIEARFNGGSGGIATVNARTVTLLRGRHLAERTETTLSSCFRLQGLYDGNADGVTDFLVTDGCSDALQLLDGNDRTALWSIPWLSFTATFTLAQLDADGPPEIVANFADGAVIDGATGALLWEYPGGFGERVLVGNVDADAHDEFVGELGVLYAGFDMHPPARTWELQAERSAPAELFDLDGDGRAELWTSDGWTEETVTVRSLPSGGVVRTLSGVIAGRITALLPARLRGPLAELGLWLDPQLMDDAAVQVITTAEQPTSVLATRNVERRFGALVHAGAPGNGKVIVSYGADHARPDGREIWAFDDGARLAPERLSGIDDPGAVGVVGLTAAQTDADASTELLVSGEGWSDAGAGPAINVLDLGTGMVQAQHYTPQGGGAPAAQQTAALRSGGVPLIAATIAEYDRCCIGDPRLRLIDARTGMTLWQTLPLTVADGERYTPVPFTTSGGEGIAVASTVGLWAYDLQGGFLWSRNAPATVVAHDPLSNRLYFSEQYGSAGWMSLEDPSVIHPFYTRGNASTVQAMALVGPHRLVVASDDGRVNIVDPDNGSVLAQIEGIGHELGKWNAMAVADGKYPWTKRIFVSTAIGWSEVRYLSDDAVFGAPGGGFEDE